MRVFGGWSERRLCLYACGYVLHFVFIRLGGRALLLLGLASRTCVVLVLSKCGISLARCLLFWFRLNGYFLYKAYVVLVLSIGVSGWVQYARTVRGSTMVERNKEYVQAARVIGIHPWLIMLRHILPNVTGPVLVIATIHLAVAIISEATLSFLGVGVPPTEPSLGTLIRIGNDFLFSGEWWITIFPGVALAVLVLAVNLLGDWLRDALNPKLR